MREKRSKYGNDPHIEMQLAALAQERQGQDTESKPHSHVGERFTVIVHNTKAAPQFLFLSVPKPASRARAKPAFGAPAASFRNADPVTHHPCGLTPQQLSDIALGSVPTEQLNTYRTALVSTFTGVGEFLAVETDTPWGSRVQHRWWLARVRRPPYQVRQAFTAGGGATFMPGDVVVEVSWLSLGEGDDDLVFTQIPGTDSMMSYCAFAVKIPLIPLDSSQHRCTMKKHVWEWLDTQLDLQVDALRGNYAPMGIIDGRQLSVPQMAPIIPAVQITPYRPPP